MKGSIGRVIEPPAANGSRKDNPQGGYFPRRSTALIIGPAFAPRVPVLADLEFPDDLFGCKLGIRLGGKIIRRHDAGDRPARNGSRLSNRGYRRAPMSRPALIGNNRKLR